jgi:glycerol dehydrogenase-like iron-containing ADH family enzyme
VAALNERLARDWDEIRTRIRAVTVPAAGLRATLEAAGVPVEPAQIGWRPEHFAGALHHAHEIRGRYTFLDLVAASARDDRP